MMLIDEQIMRNTVKITNMRKKTQKKTGKRKHKKYFKIKKSILSLL